MERYVYTQKKRAPIGLYKRRKTWRERIFKWIKITSWLIVVLFVGLVIFLKFDISGAAVITDNVLRPLLGDSNVIYLEKLFFNSSDLVQRLTHNSGSAAAPQFEDQGNGNNISGSKLNLTALNLDNNIKPISGEGIWRNRPLSLFPGQEVMAYTFIHPDPNRSYAVTTIIQMDMSVMNMASVAGIKQPGGPVGNPGPGVIPNNVVNSGKLIAAFDGGFQYKDGAFGMIVGNTTYLPLKNNLGTLVGYEGGSLKIINYTGQSLGDNVEFVRQNCPMLITNGEESVSNPKSKALWGRLAAGTVGIYTWRSGVGITKEGNLLFAVGNNLTPDTLAHALKAAGAENAIQLDINPIWVRFNIFDPISPGKYSSTTLIKDLHDGSREYLNGYNKDFFYIYKK